MDRPCTLTRWRVELDHQAAFHDTLDQLEAVLLRLPGPPRTLIVLQSRDDPAIFHTIGWFDSQSDLEAMREEADARRLLEELVSLSAEFQASAHTVMRAVDRR
jgi:antibiotic biosynthesis monooxygenase (ABM) superfamily enzyme